MGLVFRNTLSFWNKWLWIISPFFGYARATWNNEGEGLGKLKEITQNKHFSHFSCVIDNKYVKVSNARTLLPTRKYPSTIHGLCRYWCWHNRITRKQAHHLQPNRTTKRDKHRENHLCNITWKSSTKHHRCVCAYWMFIFFSTRGLTYILQWTSWTSEDTWDPSHCWWF